MATTPKILLEKIHEMNKLESMHSWDLTGFSAFLYLAGCRVSEALDMRRENFDIRENFIIVNIKTLKSKIYPLRTLPLSPIKTDEPFFTIFKTYYEDVIEGKNNQDQAFDFSSRFLINDYFKNITFKNLLQLDSQSKKWIEQDFNLHPHYLRHCRLSHLVSLFNFNEMELMKWAGWTSIKPCIFYIKLNYKDLLNKMVTPDIVIEYVNKYLAGGKVLGQ